MLYCRFLSGFKEAWYENYGQLLLRSLMRELNIPFHKYIMVRSGSLKVYTELVVSNKLSGNYELSSDLAQRLNIHSRKTINTL